MSRWLKIATGSVYILLILSILLNLSQAGYLPSIKKQENPFMGPNSSTPIPAESTSENGENFVGSMNDSYFICVFRKDADYWKGVYKGFKAAGDQLGVRTIFEGCEEYDANAQLRLFEQIVAKKPKGIALHPISAEVFKEPINRAVEAGIKVVCFAADSPESKRSTIITSDNVKEATAAADFIAKELGGSGEIGIIERPSQSNHIIRVNSFIDRITMRYPGIKVVARGAADGDESKAAKIALDMIEEHPNLSFIYCVAGIEGRGAGAGVKESGKPVKVFCYDADPPVIDMLKDGTIFAVIQPNAVNQGYWSLLSLFVEANGLVDPVSDWKKSGKPPLPALIDNGFDFVTKENGDYFYVYDNVE